MKKIYSLILFSLFTSTIIAQNLNKFYFEAEFVTKFSIGETTRKTINYRPNVSVNIPEKSKFNSPVYGLNFNLNYRINTHFSLGIGSGLNVVKYEKHPVVANEYHDKIFIPLYLRVRYQKELTDNWIILSDLNFGYQFYDFRYGNTENGFYFKETGGLLINLDFGVGKIIGKYTPIIKIGYELNQFSHETSLGWINNELEYNDKVNYKTYYHLIKLSLSIKL